jgi:hypothetical protein
VSNEQKDSKSKKNEVANALVALILVAGGALYFFGGGWEQATDKTLADINQKVASDAVSQYQIAKRNGTTMDACVHAGFVSAAYLQAKNEAEYKRWKKIEGDDCRAAGVPR